MQFPKRDENLYAFLKDLKSPEKLYRHVYTLLEDLMAGEHDPFTKVDITCARAAGATTASVLLAMAEIFLRPGDKPIVLLSKNPLASYNLMIEMLDLGENVSLLGRSRKLGEKKMIWESDDGKSEILFASENDYLVTYQDTSPEHILISDLIPLPSSSQAYKRVYFFHGAKSAVYQNSYQTHSQDSTVYPDSTWSVNASTSMPPIYNAHIPCLAKYYHWTSLASRSLLEHVMGGMRGLAFRREVLGCP